ncbi:ScbR family autoregulator-binding transcription factor [Kitasatospora nipponensis]|uniref:ScbR family autoregulator-binding transcription factor n=1 Tax=Kitasatospora nipponensis TaxID=258049 RepID=A0ABN1WSM9_9ACTN
MARERRTSNPTRRVGRPSGPTAHGAASRDCILEAAAGVFARLGYDRARMADVVTESGLTKGSVYFHFESKEALAIAVLAAKHTQRLDRVHARLAAAPEGTDRLEALLPTMLDIHRDDPDAWAIARLIQDMAASPETRPMAAELTRTWIDDVASLVRDAQEAGGRGRTTGLDPVLLATVLVGAFDGLKNTVDVLSSDAEEADAQLRASGQVLLAMLRAVLGQP